jgi:hypothetical protein
MSFSSFRSKVYSGRGVGLNGNKWQQMAAFWQHPGS